MRKTITMDGQQVKLETNAAFIFLYRQEFKSDPLKDIMQILEIGEDLENINLDVIYKLLYMMAKSANKNIPPMIEWLEGFDSIDLETVVPEVMELLISVLTTTKKK